MSVRFCRTLLTIVFAVVMCVSAALAQSAGGTIAGTVTDPSGALVAAATVTATGVETGTVYQTVSTSGGAFRFPQMQLGRYNVKVAAPGFQTLTLTGINVTIGNVSPAEAHLATGSETVTVSVNSEAPVVETENTEVSNTVTTRQIVDLPLSLGGQSAMRSVETFIFLAPGTVGPGTGGSTSGAFVAKTSGGQNFGTEELLDGVSVRREDSNSAFDEHAPSVEALTELKVTTSILPAAVGRTTGGVENFSTKSGTNQFHGTAFDIFQNEDLNANNYFNKLDISANGNNDQNQRPLDKKNDYGGSVGGPLSIPHLYKGHDRTFGFFSWEQFRQNKGGVSRSNLPTAAIRAGDFSQYLTNTQDGVNLDCNGRPALIGAIFDPTTTSTVFNPALNGGQGGTQVCRNPFPGNKIDPSRFSSVAKTTLGFIPSPNTGASDLLVQNYTYATAFPVLNTNYSIRLDHNLTAKSKLFVTYTDRDNDIVNGNPPFPGPAGAVQVQSAYAKYLRVGNDYALSPTSFNHFVAGLTRLYQFNRGNSVGGASDYDALLGLKGLSGPAFPSISFGTSNVAGGYNSLGYNNDSIQPVNAVEFIDSFTQVLGRHTITIGANFRKDQFTNEDKGANSGSFSFAQYQTAATPGDTATGDGFASFLLGQVNSSSLGIQSKAPRIGQNYYAAYLQDDFKLSHNLLINLGLRYDIDTPRNEAHGNFSNFSPTLPNSAAGGLPGALYFAGTGPGRIGGQGEFAGTYKKDFAPRIGFAYSPDSSKGTTSIRGGFGIYYGPLDYADFGSASQLGFTAQPSFNSGDNFTQAYCNGVRNVAFSSACNSGSSFDQKIPVYAAPPNLDPTQGLDSDLGDQLAAEYVAKSYGRPSQVLNWGLQVQQQLATDLIFTLGYIGTSASHLKSNLQQLNDLNPKYFSLGQQTLNSAATSLPYATFTGTVAQTLRPFPQYHNIYSQGGIENLGHSSYNALTAKLERRFHNGLNLLAAYTWSKTLTDADSTMPQFSAFDGGAGSIQNPYNLKSEKAVSTQDVPNNFVVSYLYELPLGKGKKFLNHNSVVNAIVGGFQVGGIQRYVSGTPTSFGCTSDSGLGPDGVTRVAGTPVPGTVACLRYNLVGNIVSNSPEAHARNPQDRRVFNRAAFINPSSGGPNAPFVLGTSPRVTSAYRTYFYKNEDFSIVKKLANFGEYGELQLHVDLFNALNRTHFSGLDTTPTDANFGSYNGTFGDPTVRQFILRYTF